nr:MAG TPA: hypothetical protein [Caudoviricetes sp.]
MNFVNISFKNFNKSIDSLRNFNYNILRKFDEHKLSNRNLISSPLLSSNGNGNKQECC